MSQTRRIILSIILTAFIAVGGTYLFLEKKQAQIVVKNDSTSTQTTPKPFSFGTLDNYLTGQESITYPLIFSDIKMIRDQEFTAVNFGVQNFEGFQISMQVAKMARKEAEKLKSVLLERGLVSEGAASTKNGYVGEILSSDAKAHPEPDTKSCGFGYRYFIPLANSSQDLQLEIGVSQPEWGKNGDFSNCSVFEERNYTHLKAMVDYVFANIQPAF